MIEISPAIEECSRAKCDELMAQYDHTGPMPFVIVDEADPELIVSYWTVVPTGDDFEDMARGVIFADMLVQRAKSFRDCRGLSFDPFQIIHEVMVAIAKKGSPGAIERGFLGRLAILALAAAAN